MKSGIYCIKNILNGKVYIGSSKNINNRKIHHFSDLRNKRHENSYLQNSFCKNGEKCFIFGIIEYIETEDLFEREQYWMDFYNSTNDKFGYNLSPFANRPTPWRYKSHHTEETKLKMSKTKLGKVNSDEHRENCSIAWKKMYKEGYIHPNKEKIGWNSGEKSGSWKGGKPNCPICGVKLSTYKVKSCHKHVAEYRKLMKNENINISLGEEIER